MSQALYENFFLKLQNENLTGNITSVIASCEVNLLNALRFSFPEETIRTDWMLYKKVIFLNFVYTELYNAIIPTTS